MEMSISEQRLRNYIDSDKTYQDYKKSNKEPSDFERFCFVHCRDIEDVLNVLDEIREYVKKYNDLLQILDKVKE